ncbi:dipeptide ABC transporter ATP-binding protein [Enteractinococcus coprophilus]|uniref:Peptide/nickel transport system ATP-binding protein n=1 Tax=Enteractinococcus coprophilus TaxID=1027633 RepID=A0A543A022_9MICC|nr:ABC transporter ATP-binding protein [Enteractinococcus coprophilus]TQL65939.1 peptide/nickel transport system ATP-binding protein [Enteractinococcus coprophilus]
MTQPLLEVSDLHIDFSVDKRSVNAVRGLNMTIYPGQTVAIVGESGSGKSTTAHAIIDLLPGTGKVTQGSIRYEGTDLVKLPARKRRGYRGSHIGLVPQDPLSNLNPLYKVGAQIREVLEVNNVAKGKAADARVVELLEEAGLPDAKRRAQQYPHEFSGGMRQRALIAAGLAARPKLLIADEPTSALDVTVQKQILDHLDDLTSELGVAVLLITHDLGLAAERADHLVVMYKGEVVESGPALAILQDPQHPYSKRLINAAPSLQSERVSAQERTAIRRAAQEHVSEETEVDVETPAMQIQSLTKVFKLPGKGFSKTDLIAAQQVSFDLARGTTTALVGESGSGKSTVARMVLGLETPTEGHVYFDGVDISTITSRDQQLKFRRRIQPVFQNPYASLDPMFSIYEAIEEPLVVHQVGSKTEREERVRTLLDQVSLPHTVMNRYPNELSGGQRQRVAIARALALNPEVLVLDEAVSALDVLVQDQILQLLNDLQVELGLSYLFITHDLAVVRQIADDVLVMQGGRVVEQADANSIFNNPQEPYTQKLLAAIPGRDIPLAG